MRLRPARATTAYRVFLSSATDANTLRKRVKRLVEDVFNPQLLEADAGFVVLLDMWERAAAQRAGAGQTVNQLFVDRALKSDITIVLILDSLGGGTREAVEAVLGQDDVQLSVLRLTTKDGDAADADEAGQFILANRDQFLYEMKRAALNSADSWLMLVRTLFAIVLRGVVPSEGGAYYESR
jgi:hypothetical protein